MTVITAEIVETAFGLGNDSGDAHLVLVGDVVKVLPAREIDRSMLLLAPLGGPRRDRRIRHRLRRGR